MRTHRFRRPDIHVGGLMFYCDSSLFLFFVSYSPSLLEIGHMLGNECDLEMYVWNLGYTSPYTNRGLKTVFFRRLRYVTATLKAYVFRTKSNIHSRASALQTKRGLLYRSKMWWTLDHKRLQTRHAFYPPSVNSTFCFIARLRRRRSANGTQPNFTKRWTVNRANKLS